MSAPDPLIGHEVPIAFKWEDAGFRQTPNDDTYKVPGHDTVLNTKDGAHEAVRVFNPGTNRAADIIEQTFSGSWGFECILSDPWWLRAILGSASTSGPTNSVYTHTFQDGPPSPMRIYVGEDNNQNIEELHGCVVSDAEVTVDVEGNASLSMNGAYAKAEQDTSSGLFTQPTPDERAMTFAQASLSVGGANYRLAQSATISVSLNPDMIFELGDRFPVTWSPKAFHVDMSYDRIRQTKENHDRFYGGATSMQQKMENEQDVVVDFDNGETGADTNRLKFTAKNNIPDSLSEEALGDEESDVQVSMDEMGRDLIAEASNGTSTAK